jgi:peptidyl-prolyl cis-trans isomerase C
MNRLRLILMVALLATGIAAAVAWRQRQPIVATGSVVATVNGTPIGERELQIRVATLLPMASFHGNIPREKLASLERAALDALILDELIWQDARARGRRPEPAAVEAELSNVRRRFESEAAFDAALHEGQVTLDGFRKYLARTLLVRQERLERAALPAPTEAEIAAYYESNKTEFLRPEQVHLKEILVRVDPAAEPTDELKAKARADAVFARVRGGADFATLAREVSDDSFGAKGGDLGWIHRGRLDPGLERDVFAAPVGDLRQARSLAGFHVFTVVERQSPQQLSLEETRPAIVDRLQRARREAARRDWEQRLLASAHVEILDLALLHATPMEVRAFESMPVGMPARTPPLPPSH